MRLHAIITARRGYRSASQASVMPPMKVGTMLAANVTAASSAERVRSYTSTVSATRASWSPTTDNSWATHRARNSATANTSRNVVLAACSVATPRATACLVMSSSGSARAVVFGNHILTDSCLRLQQTGLHGTERC